MRIVFSCLFVCIIYTAQSQTIDLPLDSVKTVLCKRWEVDYSLMGTMKISRTAGAPEFNYEFFKDQTFLLTSNDPKEREKGKWIYDPKKKLIQLSFTDRNPGDLIALSKNELIMRLNLEKDNPQKPEIKLVLKPRTDTSSTPMQKTGRTTAASNSVNIKNASLKNSDSAILYVGRNNVIEIEGAEETVMMSVAGSGARVTKIDKRKFIVTVSKEGSVVISAIQNYKTVATKQFKAVLFKN